MQSGQTGLTRVSWVTNALALLGLGLILAGWLAPSGKLLEHGGIICCGLMQILLGFDRLRAKTYGKLLVFTGSVMVISGMYRALSFLGLLG